MFMEVVLLHRPADVSNALASRRQARVLQTPDRLKSILLLILLGGDFFESDLRLTDALVEGIYLRIQRVDHVLESPQRLKRWGHLTLLVWPVVILRHTYHTSLFGSPATSLHERPVTLRTHPPHDGVAFLAAP